MNKTGAIARRKAEAAMQRRLERGAAKMQRKRERAIKAHCPESDDGRHVREREYDGSVYCWSCKSWLGGGYVDSPTNHW